MDDDSGDDGGDDGDDDGNGDDGGDKAILFWGGFSFSLKLLLLLDDDFDQRPVQ